MEEGRVTKVSARKSSTPTPQHSSTAQNRSFDSVSTATAARELGLGMFDEENEAGELLLGFYFRLEISSLGKFTFGIFYLWDFLFS